MFFEQNSHLNEKWASSIINNHKLNLVLFEQEFLIFLLLSFLYSKALLLLFPVLSMNKTMYVWVKHANKNISQINESKYVNYLLPKIIKDVGVCSDRVLWN